MKRMLNKVILFNLVFASAVVQASSVGNGIDVVVKAAGGQIAYRGKIDANGKFATAGLSPGAYVVEFHSAKALKGQLSVAATGGKATIQASDVTGEKFALGGVAMTVPVGKAGKLTGAVVASGQKAASAPERMETVRAIVKVANGKRYVWVPGPIGSNMGGKWVEEGKDGAAVSTSNKNGEDAEALRRMTGVQDGGRARVFDQGGTAARGGGGQ